MENIVLKGGLNLQGKLTAISSKSHVHRLIVCGCLSDKGCKIKYESSLSNDIMATISCFTSLGAVINANDGIIDIVKPIDKKNIPSNPVLDCNESGSTARFILPIISVLCKGATLTGKGRLPDRPFDELCISLEEHGAKFSSHRLPITVQETAKPENYYNISGNISSQYLSGLLFTLPICKATGIRLSTELQSAGYVKLTENAMSVFGVKTTLNQNTYTQEGTYHTPGNELLYAEGDWSNAAFWLCGASDTPITLNGLNHDSAQPDRQVLELLTEMGANITTLDNSVTISIPNGTHGISFDAKNIPDLVPILAVRAAVSEGKTVISGIERLRIKESDRVATVCEMINSLGGIANSDENHIYIKGVRKLKGGTVNSYNDHRIAMSAAIAALFSENAVEIVGSNAASKSYPEFFEHYKKMTEENI